MAVYDSIATLPDSSKRSILVIGNFDGVHLGHQALLAHGKELAAGLGTSLGVLTFEPHPRKLFRPDDPPFRITSPAQKHDLLEKHGVDFIVTLPFDWAFASQSAEEFTQKILVEGFAPVRVVIGEGFRFGQLRKGTAATIEQAGLPVTAFAPVAGTDGAVYSSSDVRRHLQAGDIDAANTILGRAWEVQGDIVRGDRRGHELGYPTANVPLCGIIHPAYGIYAAQLRIDGEENWRMAAVNIGIRPMFELSVGQIEAHILDMEDRDLYGRILHIRPVRRLRGEAKFASLEELIAQMDKDCIETRTILSAI